MALNSLHYVSSVAEFDMKPRTAIEDAFIYSVFNLGS